VKRLALLACLPGCFLFRSGDPASCPQGKVVELGLQEEVAHFAGCTKAAGLTIRTGATIDVTPLNQLEEITGDLSIGPTVGLDSVALNGLVRVSGTSRVVSNGSLRGLFLPRLEHAGRVEVENNVVLSTISMPRLIDVQGSLVVTDNHALELLSATTLTTIGSELVIVNHPKLNLVELPKLSHMETMRVEDNPQMPAELLETLRNKATLAAGP
jgi:hypothetical protein